MEGSILKYNFRYKSDRKRKTEMMMVLFVSIVLDHKKTEREILKDLFLAAKVLEAHLYKSS